MKQSDAKKLFIELTNERLESKGFKLKKTRDTEAVYIREKMNGFERMGISTYNYYPEVVFGMGTMKRYNKIEKILLDINEKYNLELRLSKDEWTLSYRGSHSKRKLQLYEVEHKDNELGVHESTKILMDFIENELLPTYDLFDDLREIDKRINGDEENFWETDKNNNALPFNLGEYFHERRLIIAWLCNNFQFDFISDSTFKFFEKSMLKNTGQPYHYDRKDLSLRIPATINYLKENVSPMY